MTKETQKVLLFVLKIIKDKKSLFFWLTVRFVSAILPLITIWQFSQLFNFLENGLKSTELVVAIFMLFIVRILDNFLRLKSVTKLEENISNISFDIHNFFLSDLKSDTKEERHASVQAIRNFSDASSLTLNLVKQPGIDSLVSLIFIPTTLFFIDFQIFIIVVAYSLIYFFIDHYTTQHYARLKNVLNTRTENYYAKLQESNDFDLEQTGFTRHFAHLTRWGFTEWFILQNTAVFFYSLIILILVFSVISGQKSISSLVLISGYVSQVQVYLNSFSSIKDSLTDTLVGLERLAKNPTISAINLDDLT